MNQFSKNFLILLLLNRYRFYRYFLLIKLLQDYFPELQKHYTPIKANLIKTMEQKPYPILTAAFLVGVVLSRLIKRKKSRNN